MQEIFVGRQGIFDRDLNIYAYELLYRSSEKNSAGSFDGETATSQVVVNAIMEIGLDRVVGDRRAFINLTRSFLVGENPVPFPVKQLVLEVLEDVEVDATLMDGVRSLSGQGFMIALDDFVYHDSLKPLVEAADIIKIDLQALDRETVKKHLAVLRQYPVKLVAEKVETQEDYDFCLDQGFDYFQGYFLCRPRVMRGRKMPANRLATLRLLARLQDPQVEAKELDTLISQDVSLSYKLLRYINSAFFGLPRKVESISQAVVYLGLRTIKTWVSLIVLSGIDDKPLELMTTAMVRAKMCELLAEAVDDHGKDIYFTVGLFSTLDAMMDTPMEDILRSLPLTEEIQQALLNHQGRHGQALACVLAYEHHHWDTVQFEDLEASQIRQAYLQAIQWADQSAQELHH